MNTPLDIKPLTQEAFAPFGEVIQVQDTPSVIINQGNCERYTDLATLDFTDGRAGVSVFRAKPYPSPLSRGLVERHPEGSQTFIPLSEEPFLVIVAQDNDGQPTTPVVFKTSGAQGVSYRRNTWHGVLAPIAGNGLFAVIDRIGDGVNLEEHWFERPYTINF